MSESVTIARKSHDHLLRTRDRALREAEWERERVESVTRWAEQAFGEQRRLADRLDRVVAAAASLGVSIQDINAALDGPTPDAHPASRESEQAAAGAVSG